MWRRGSESELRRILIQRKLQIRKTQEKQKTQQSQTTIPFLSHGPVAKQKAPSQAGWSQPFACEMSLMEAREGMYSWFYAQHL